MTKKVLTPDGKHLMELPTMEMPAAHDFTYDIWGNAEYVKARIAYDAHTRKLISRAIPIVELAVKHQWKQGQVLTENVDFTLHDGSNNWPVSYKGIVAIPMKSEPTAASSADYCEEKKHEHKLSVYFQSGTPYSIEQLAVKIMDALYDGTSTTVVGTLDEPASAQAPPTDSGEEKNSGCGICGSALVGIRAKYPKGPMRLICACCTYERLEQINEISNPNYGIAYKTNPE